MEGISEHELRQWELDEGIPQADDPFIKKYFQGRDALMMQEDKHRSDADFAQLLSPMAKEACAIVGQIRFEEQQTVWSAAAEDALAEDSEGDVYPGMMFTLAKERMEATKLWRIVRRMPKGALLHCHFEAMVDQDWLFRACIDAGVFCIAAAAGFDTAAKLLAQPFEFSFSAAAPPTQGGSLWSSRYAAGQPVALAAAADAFPEGGREGFVEWLKLRLSVSPQESVNHHHGPNAIWRKFSACFGTLAPLVFYEPIFRGAVAHMCAQLLADGVRWVDMRAAFELAHFRRAGAAAPDADYIGCLRAFDEEVQRFCASAAGRGFWGARMIWTTLRMKDSRAIVTSMKHCIAVKVALPHVISGFDLVGQEDLGRSLEELTPLLFYFRKLCAAAQVTIPFVFHAGETLGSGSATDINLFDAVSLGTRRIGHGFSLYKHPLLMNMVRDRRILVEVCPVSNEVLRLCSSIAAHPLPALLANGVAVSLSSDDPTVLGHGTAGVSHDFFQCLQAIESLGLEGLGCLAENSVRWALWEDLDNKAWVEDVKAGAYGDGVRAQRMKEWKSEWERFCQWVCMEFSDEGFPDLDEEDEEAEEAEGKQPAV